MLETNSSSNDLNYSADMFLKAAFDYELRNSLQTMPIEYKNEGWRAVVAYLEDRIKEIDKRYKK